MVTVRFKVAILLLPLVAPIVVCIQLYFGMYCLVCFLAKNHCVCVYVCVCVSPLSLCYIAYSIISISYLNDSVRVILCDSSWRYGVVYHL